MIRDLNNQWLTLKMYDDNEMYNRVRIVPCIYENYSVMYHVFSSLSDYIHKIKCNDIVPYVTNYIQKFNGFVIEIITMKNFECINRLKIKLKTEIDIKKLFIIVNKCHLSNILFFNDIYNKSAIKIQRAYNIWKWKIDNLWNTNTEIGIKYFYFKNRYHIKCIL